MSNNLPRRMADHQLAMARDSLALHARRFAESAAQYANEVPSADGVSGGAHRLIQDATSLLQEAARLDGMCDIAGLIPEKETTP